MKVSEIVREYFPSATDGEVEFLIWERTAFPLADESRIREQLASFKAATDKYPRGRFCEQCDQLAFPNSWFCATCAVGFQQTPLLTA